MNSVCNGDYRWVAAPVTAGPGKQAAKQGARSSPWCPFPTVRQGFRHGKRGSNGKNGRLPQTVRQQFSRQRADAEMGPGPTVWLKRLPEVLAVVGDEHGTAAVEWLRPERDRESSFRLSIHDPAGRERKPRKAVTPITAVTAVTAVTAITGITGITAITAGTGKKRKTHWLIPRFRGCAPKILRTSVGAHGDSLRWEREGDQCQSILTSSPTIKECGRRPSRNGFRATAEGDGTLTPGAQSAMQPNATRECQSLRMSSPTGFVVAKITVNYG